MSEIDLDALEQKARAATPGDWLPESTEMYEDGEATCVYRALGPPCGVEGDPEQCDDAADQAHRDAAFIAAASPDVILALVARVRAAEGALEAVMKASALDWKAQTDDEADVAWSEALHRVREALARRGGTT